MIGGLITIGYARTLYRPVFPIKLGADAIVFVSDRDPGSQLYVMNSDGTDETRLTYMTYSSPDWWFPSSWVPYYDAVINRHPQPAPNGQGVVFLSSVDRNYAFYQIHLDGSGLTRLPTPNTVLGNPNAVLSPDGQQIAFVKFDRNDRTKASLAVVQADGSGEHCLTCHLSTPVLDPAWSSDGRFIVFALRNSNGTQIYRIEADGSNLIQLTDVPGTQNDQPAWSPDGHYIAFRSNRDGPRTEIYVMQADGSGQSRLTTAGSEIEPAWSPNGQQIVFASARDGGKGQIYTMNKDGSNQTRLTKNTSSDSEPVWLRMSAGK